MADFIGSKCIVCGQPFKDGDDVVVCPECGTPYHRECYKEAGKCINDELHANGESWKADREKVQDGIRCRRCGFNNDKDRIFCESCGTPLQENIDQAQDRESKENHDPNEPRPNNGRVEFSPFGERTVYDKDSVIDGVRLEDYAGYVKSNPFTFLMSFIRFGKYGGKLSLNIGAFLFPEVYFLFRKMKVWGFISLIICAAFTVPVLITQFAVGYAGIRINFSFDATGKTFAMIADMCWYGLMVWRIFAGLMANYFYYKKAKSDISHIRETADGEQEVKERIALKGGVSWPAAIVGYGFFSGLVIGVVFLINQLF